MANRLDIIIFGATGFTGKHIIPELRKLIKLESLQLTWGVAARSEKKIKDVLVEIGEKSGEDFSKVPIIAADIKDEESLKKMTGQAKLIINAVGPYQLYGEPVIKACIATGTHHVDISGEPQYMETMQLHYHEAAVEKGIYLLSACGFDSIPTDLGVIFLQRNFNGTLNSIETYLETSDSESLPGASFNYATWESVVYASTNDNKLRGIRSKLFPNGLPTFIPKLKSKGLVHKSNVINKWAIPFVGADQSVVHRSQYFLYEHGKQRPVQIETYVGIDSIYNLLLLFTLGAFLVLFCKFDFTRGLLLKHPKFFSAGYFSHEGPTEEKQKATKFHVLLSGEGWSEKLPSPDDEYKIPPTGKVMAKVSGTNPGYGATCIAIGLSAITVLTETDKLPDGGGVYPPGAAFANTSIIDKLDKYGLKFELLSNL